MTNGILTSIKFRDDSFSVKNIEGSKPFRDFFVKIIKLG